VGERRLYLIDQRHDVAGITGITHGQVHGKNEAGGGLSDDAGLAAKLGGTVALAFTDGGNGGIVGIDNFAAGQDLAVGETARLGDDLLMSREGEGQRGVPACPLLLRQRRTLEMGLRGLRQLGHRLARGQQERFGLAHQAHKDFPLPSALAPKAAHNLGQLQVELLRLLLQRRALDRAVGGEGGNDLENFFFALYKVAASLTR
jgi:hypothetical protein